MQHPGVKPASADAATLVVTSNGDLALLNLWNDCTVGRLEMRVKNFGPGSSSQFSRVRAEGIVGLGRSSGGNKFKELARGINCDLRDRKLVVKTQNGMAVWKL